MASINDRFRDFQVAQQVRWIRVQNRDVRAALRLLADTERRVTEYLRQQSRMDDARYTRARLLALREQLGLLVAALETRLTTELEENARRASATSGRVEADALRRILPAGLDVTTPNLAVLEVAATSASYLGATLSEWSRSFHRSLNETTWRSVQAGIIAGRTTDELTRDLLGTRAANMKDGDLEPRRRGMEALVRTSINHAVSAGRQAVWEANSDLISSIQWVSTLDSRTTPICQGRDGKVGPVNDGDDWTPPDGADLLEPPFARPPAHINCRSTTVAVTRSWRDLGIDEDELAPATRASMDGQVSAKTTYFEWLGRQSAAVQREVLGPSRYDLWKKGGVTPDRFQNDKGRLYTLDEMQKRAPTAFEEAGL